jgi:hypothetical protein
MKDFAKGFLFGIMVATAVLVGFGISDFEMESILAVEGSCGLIYGVIALFKK